MPEIQYRASRVCRALGNPTAYQILKILLGKRKTPSKIADELGISKTLVSATLRILKFCIHIIIMYQVSCVVNQI